MAANLHYLFYVDYYGDLKKGDQTEASLKALDFSEKNNVLVGATPTPAQPPLPEDLAFLPGFAPQTFSLVTTYPGLLAGIGSPHTAGDNDSEIKLGFSLDPVTGLPYLPASGVKGVLRSAFRNAEPYVADQLREILKLPEEAPPELLEKLETAVFGEWCGDDEKTKKQTAGPVERDVFLDAVVTGTPQNGTVLALDSITPHRNWETPSLDGLTEPIPLTLLRVKPGVTFTFSFLLRESSFGGGTTVKAEQKAALFKAILQDLGVGAKTHTGYGYLEEPQPGRAARTNTGIEKS